MRNQSLYDTILGKITTTVLQLSFSEKEQHVLSAITNAADKLDLDTYLIGGYVRDKIMGRPSEDMDVVCVGDGILLAEKAASQLGVANPVVFKRFGTAMIKYDNLEIEFVGARKESYSPESRNPTVDAGSLEDDQNRRDFSINALAYRLNSDGYGRFLDPFGGLDDISNKIIRTPMAPDRTFSDDPLRMLRAIRFATQLDFSIDQDTLNGIMRNKDRIRIITYERIITELNKIILSSVPSTGFKYLMDCGLIQLIFPEMHELKGAEYIDGIGHKDNYYHTLQVLDNVAKVSDDLWLRWAAILHDIGKPKTKRFDAKAGWTFHGHDAVGAGMVPKIFRKMKLPLDHKMHYVKKLVRLHLRPISLTNENITDSAVRRLLYDAGEDIDDLMILCEADITTKNYRKLNRFLANYEIVKQKMIEIEEKDHLRNWQPPISGEEIMSTFGIPPSRTVGNIKNAIKEAILDGEIDNNYDEAYAFMIKKAESLGIVQKQN